MEEATKEDNKKVEQEEKKKSNVFINVLILFVIFMVSLFMYAKYIGIKGISIKEYRVEDELIPDSFSGTKIIYLSDYLIGSTVNLEDVEESVNRINELKPDLVLFGGGLISDGYKLNDEDKLILINMFSKIDVKLGKYAVKGENDNDFFEEVMNQSGFIILNNNYELIYNEGNIPICLTGVSSYNKGLYDLNSSFKFSENIQNCYTVVFTHEADIITNIFESPYKTNLILAGNSLGGEINLPFYGPVVTFKGNDKYYLDYYKENETKIYISSGFGTKKYNMRLFNKPSFNFFRLKS